VIGDEYLVIRDVASRIGGSRHEAFKLTRQERDLIVERMFVDAEIEGRLRNARSSNIEDTFTDEDDGTADAVMQEAKAFTPRRGQYLAFIYYYTKIHGRAPAEADLQRYFRVTPPVVHQMIKALVAHGFIDREPGTARSIRLRLTRAQLPDLE